MAIREATTSVEEPRPSGPRPDRRRRRRDLRAGPFPTAAMDQWHDTEAALTQLYRHAEGRAIEAIDWYLQDKRGKRIWSRGLRLLVILLVTAGGLQPLLDAAAPGPSRTAWGYVLLALAAWAAECARGASRTVDPKQVQNRLALLRAFSDDVAALLQQETASWVLEFQSNLLRLERERSDGARARPGSVPLPGTAEP